MKLCHINAFATGTTIYNVAEKRLASDFLESIEVFYILIVNSRSGTNNSIHVISIAHTQRVNPLFNVHIVICWWLITIIYLFIIPSILSRKTEANASQLIEMNLLVLKVYVVGSILQLHYIELPVMKEWTVSEVSGTH